MMSHLMKTSLLPNEHLQKESRASWWRGLGTVSGRLYCTDQRLMFESHKFNFRGGTTTIELSQIIEARLGHRKLFGFFPLHSNCLEVQSQYGATRWFVVSDLLHWIITIDKLRTGTVQIAIPFSTIS